jgi:hypothetical protein
MSSFRRHRDSPRLPLDFRNNSAPRLGLPDVNERHNCGQCERKVLLELGVTAMDAVVVGATFVGSIVTAFVVQKAVLGAMLRAFERGRTARR